jgi:hypothetical protein
MSNINTLLKKRRALLKELYSLHQLVCGSLFLRNLNGKPRHILSQMLDGKQRQTYIAGRHLEAVTQGVCEYERALEILSELGQINISLIKQEAGRE